MGWSFCTDASLCTHGSSQPETTSLLGHIPIKPEKNSVNELYSFLNYQNTRSLREAQIDRYGISDVKTFSILISHKIVWPFLDYC